MNSILDVDEDYDLVNCSDKISLKEKRELQNTFVVNRPVYTQHEFDENHGAKSTKKPVKTKIRQSLEKFKQKYCTPQGVKAIVLSLFPVWRIMRKYKWKEWILADLIAGIIVGIMHIPQGMAYALLAELKPMYGLYVSFFPSIVYFFFSTSRHISIGTIAIVSLLTGKFIDSSTMNYPIVLDSSALLVDNSTVSEAIDSARAARVAGFCMCVGIVQFLMGLLRLGYLTRYLSDPLISGFTVGAAIHVFTSQVKSCFGIKIPKQVGIFNIPKTYYYIFSYITKTNIPTLILTLTCIVILYVNKTYINPRVIRKIKVPVPMELIVVIFTTLASKFIELEKKYNVSVVGEISKGLPQPTPPNLNYIQHYIPDVFITAIIAFSVCISLAKMFGRKHGYNVDPNQELFAYGFMNFFASFFFCYPSAASVSRSAVQESAGGKTQLTSLVSSVMLLFVLLFIGPLFHSLPVCALASIILVALKGILMQFSELKELWLFSLWDFGTWLMTFLGTVVLDVEYGLLIGIALSIITVMLRTQSPKSHVLGQVTGTDLYKNIDVYDKCKEIDGIKIFRYEGSVYYASSDHFKSSLYHKVNCNPRKTKLLIQKLDSKVKKLEKKLVLSEISETSMNGTVEEVENPMVVRKKELEQQLEVLHNPKIHHVIIDCSTWGYIDYVGVKTLYNVIEEFKAIDVTVLLANPKTDIRETFARSNFYDLIDDRIIYVSVHDAVVNSLFDHKITDSEI